MCCRAIGQRKFSNIATETTLVLGAVYKLPLRQTEGFVRSLLGPMGLDLPVPDHTTLARRRRTVEVEMHAPGVIVFLPHRVSPI